MRSRKCARLLARRPAVWAGWNLPATIGLIKHQLFHAEILRKRATQDVSMHRNETGWSRRWTEHKERGRRSKGRSVASVRSHNRLQPAPPVLKALEKRTPTPGSRPTE